MAKIFIKYNILSHPYIGDPGSQNEVWSEIEIYSEDQFSKYTIIKWQWDLKSVVNCFIENQLSITEGVLPIKHKQEDNNIFKLIQNEYDKLNINSSDFEVAYDELYNYSLNHDLGCAFIGTDIRNIYFGRINKILEISAYSEDFEYRFTIENIQDFFREIKSIHRYIENLPKS